VKAPQNTINEYNISVMRKINNPEAEIGTASNQVAKNLPIGNKEAIKKTIENIVRDIIIYSDLLGTKRALRDAENTDKYDDEIDIIYKMLYDSTLLLNERIDEVINNVK
jgi:hypothetical protein